MFVTDQRFSDWSMSNLTNHAVSRATIYLAMRILPRPTLKALEKLYQTVRLLFSRLYVDKYLSIKTHSAKQILRISEFFKDYCCI